MLAPVGGEGAADIDLRARKAAALITAYEAGFTRMRFEHGAFDGHGGLLIAWANENRLCGFSGPFGLRIPFRR
jgi:hypothetical protein